MAVAGASLPRGPTALGDAPHPLLKDIAQGFAEQRRPIEASGHVDVVVVEG